MAQYGLPYKYPKAVEEAADKITGEITAEDYAEREDFRNVFTCTIDPRDAKDFDDALSIRKLDGGLWEVGVHIADVSHYVTEGSIIDKEAVKRATSVYLVDRTIPMLPERLCNFICSLRPDEEKLAYSVIFNLDEDANVRSFRIKHTVIKSNRRYAYEEVQQLLEDNGVVDGTGEPAPPATAAHPYKGENAELLIKLDALAKKLRAARFKNGAVKFDSEELHFDVDDKGKPIRCYYKRSKDANKLVEEFMLLANRTVAESVGKVKKGKTAKTLPYRVHDNPDPQKMETLREFIAKFGYRVKTDGTKKAMAKSINRLMEECEGHPEQNLIQKVALRAMMKAKYTTKNIGHFGLAFEYYTHFTSPIRRYPDLAIHRILSEMLLGASASQLQKDFNEFAQQASEKSSKQEVAAVRIERDVEDLYKAEYMHNHLGEVYTGTVAGITPRGVFVELENTVEGFVPAAQLCKGEPQVIDGVSMLDPLTGKSWMLGSSMKIQVAAADVALGRIDFEYMVE